MAPSPTPQTYLGIKAFAVLGVIRAASATPRVLSTGRRRDPVVITTSTPALAIATLPQRTERIFSFLCGHTPGFLLLLLFACLFLLVLLFLFLFN